MNQLIPNWKGRCPNCGKRMVADDLITMDAQGYHCECGLEGWENGWTGKFEVTKIPTEVQCS